MTAHVHLGTVLVLGAYGLAGREIVAGLLAKTDLRVIASGRNAQRLGKLATRPSHDHLSTRLLDAYDAEALAQYESTRGGAVRGAAGGALAGLVIGAIAGDAGKGAAIGAVAGGAAGGARSRRGRAAAQEAFEAAVAEFQSGFRLWDRHWMACMIGNGYGVG